MQTFIDKSAVVTSSEKIQLMPEEKARIRRRLGEPTVSKEESFRRACEYFKI